MSKKKTHVTQVDKGLDETQFNALTAGQQGISTQVSDNLAAIQKEAADAQARFEQAAAQRDAAQAAAASAAASAQADAAAKFSTLQGDITGGFDATKQRFDTVDDTLSTGFENIGTTQAANMTRLVGDDPAELGGIIGTGIQDQTTALQGTMASNQAALVGDDGTGGAIGALSTKVGDQGDRLFNQAQTNMNTLVGEDGDAGIIGTGFTNISDLVNTRADAAATDRETRATALSDQMTESTEALTELATSNQVDNAAQQKAILDLINKYGGDAAQYFADLSANQAGISSDLGAAQSDLTNFRGAFDRDATLANQQRARLEAANQYQTNEILRGQAGLQSGQTAGFAAAANTAGTVEQTQKDFANIAKMITAGFQTSDATTNSLKTEFQDRLATIRNALGDENLTIDDTIRKTYTDMVNSFDATGALIARTSLDNGNFISRAIDDTGNLLLAEFNTAGDRLGQQSININRMMAQLDSMGYVMGTNANMAGMSGAGFATPYGLTFGG